MAGENMVLIVATYPDAGEAAADYKTLKDAQDAGEYKVVGAVVMSRDEQGKVAVDEHGGGAVGAATGIGAVGGFVVGLFAPPLLLATVIGGAVGAGLGALVKRHEEKEMGADLEEYLPPGTSAIVAVVDDVYADRVERALVKASKKIDKAIDSGDVDKLKKALADAGHDVDAAIAS
jgi:uncharacterized membrane protein